MKKRIIIAAIALVFGIMAGCGTAAEPAASKASGSSPSKTAVETADSSESAAESQESEKSDVSETLSDLNSKFSSGEADKEEKLQSAAEKIKSEVDPTASSAVSEIIADVNSVIKAVTDDIESDADRGESGSSEKESSAAASDSYGTESAAENNCCPDISAAYADDVKNEITEYDEYTIDDSEYSMGVMLTAKKNVTDLRIVSLSMSEFFADTEPLFLTDDLYKYGDLAAGKSLRLQMSFPGDMPTTGILYTDENGEIKVYALTQSGRDGSLVIFEI